MKKLLAITLALVLIVALAACAKEKDNGGDVTTDDFKVGIILIGDENEGYTYSHIEGIRLAVAALGLSESQLILKYDIPEDEKCYDTAVDLAEQGCKVIFANSFGHESYLIQASKEYPDIQFVHATGQSAARENLPNFSNHFTRIFEARYVSGVVAGMKLKELMDDGLVDDPHVGYVGAYPYAEVVSGYTAFFLGVRSIVPEAYMDVIYTNSWFDMTAEAEAANTLMARGCVILSQHADSTGAPGAVEDANKGGKPVYIVGYNVSMLNVAPNAALTSPTNVWEVNYETIIDLVMKGEPVPKDIATGYAEGGVAITALGNSVAEGTAARVEEIIAAIKSGALHVFATNTWTVGGEELESYDQSWGFEGTELIWDGRFNESYVISASLFDIRIDGITEL
ncbi:MAG: BMP family ABC transporter substrate-binding protein [Clostridiales bacterium]|nr:BMP family ABC transporter substrate-binding protein [Clostridiales bacterium]